MSEQDLAVSVEIQQAASLYGIASVIIGTGKAPNKSALKTVIKKARKAVLSGIGEDEGWAIMRANKEPIEQYLKGVKNDPRLDGIQTFKMYQAAVDDLAESCMKGYKALF